MAKLMIMPIILATVKKGIINGELNPSNLKVITNIKIAILNFFEFCL